MRLPDITFVGGPIDDAGIFDALPPELQHLLTTAGNGLVAYRGALHLRGACDGPAWHSLRDAWRSDRAFHRRYPQVVAADIPFAEDAVGDQWLLRDGIVVKLYAESGDVEHLGVKLDEFWLAVQRSPLEMLGLRPLLQFESEGGEMQPGQLLSVYPPYVTAEARGGVSMRAVSTEDRRSFLADFAASISGLPDGTRLQLRTDL